MTGFATPAWFRTRDVRDNVAPRLPLGVAEARYFNAPDAHAIPDE